MFFLAKRIILFLVESFFSQVFSLSLTSDPLQQALRPSDEASRVLSRALMCSDVLWNVFSYDRMCSLVIECVLLL